MSNDFTSGVIAAPVLPFHDDGTIDWPSYETYIAQVAEGGARAIAMNMAASEGGSLTPDEQSQVIRRTKSVLDGACPVISGVLSGYTIGAVATAKRMVDAGADGLVIFPSLPTFIPKPIPIDMLVEFHADIAAAVDVPVIAFQTSNSDYPQGTLTELAKIPNLVAVKDAAFSFEKASAIVDEVKGLNGRIAVLTGNDTFILENMLLGASGALIGFAGTATAALVRMQELAAKGAITEAYAIWFKLGPLARLCWTAPLRDYRVRMKYVLMRQGILPNCVARKPQPAITQADRDAIDRCFEAHGLDDPAYLPAGRRRAPLKAAS
ncbi:dihydrodipicolinate synthase family protein [Bosea sp. (in: a-proteobacteria)]|uniref:dihydrodipicolinate synthase family protein n=1 Tax=Bosea sp. (in: a-proteobacteria) TaxID=1871050 RepID=UPI00262C133C|nr:dihydrodipicolinate synthase family protein [Bosea sp. (in: a-proteobacteria)]MCO5090379.1 dihydrodipicolinate synthase family protein [Bosea sp. (in: a-proteobacteria)]